MQQDPVFHAYRNREIDPLVWRINFSGGPVAGSLSLPNDIRAGMYVLTAYTNWMKNGSSETFYSQKICIMNLSEDVAGFIQSDHTGINLPGNIKSGTQGL